MIAIIVVPKLIATQLEIFTCTNHDRYSRKKCGKIRKLRNHTFSVIMTFEVLPFKNKSSER